jgi:excisionase family DNA binding protein
MPEPVTWTPSAAEALKRLEGRLFATTTETAAILRYDTRTLRKAIDAGEIPSVRVGATRRVPVSWITERARLSTDGGDDAAA